MKNLVFTSAGDYSKHVAHWMSDASIRNFDLVVAYFGDSIGKYRGTADLTFDRKGSKFQNLVHALQHHPALMSSYDRYFILDDDIELKTSEINALFEMSNSLGLDLCQPAYGEGSHTIWEILRQRPESMWRSSNFVECGVPLFSKRAFQLCIPSFSLGVSGNGMDHAWSHIIHQVGGEIGIIDCIPCIHPPRLSEIDLLISRQEQGEEGVELLRRLGMPFLEPSVTVDCRGTQTYAACETLEEQSLLAG